MKTFWNTRFTKRNYECTNIMAYRADAAPADFWVECQESSLRGLSQLWTERGVTYFGHL